MPTRAKGKTGKRYSEAEKAKVLAFVESQGRGGITAAIKRFKVSYIAIRSWMNKSGKVTKRGRKPGKAAPVKIKGLKGILGLIRRTESNLAALKARVSALG